ncbi:hypothetical protein KFZ76_04940 [Methylovulum psychrotolerans]|uniref:hypothetical protein n=1 Tax=Methylovulum psychrotolerans TaxID=1704499 RepID=UPI001BFF84C1|nr:hypothetical protein [Methylovulum psychrotolerans]MBT9097054.1 hypothetical protein [Methylovulum psychrotolerans]
MINRVFGHIVQIISLALLLTACDQDPFHQSYREIAGIYSLHRWEDGTTYYIENQNAQNQDQGGGIINGTVQKIGWNANYILVKRLSTYQGDPSGWMLIDVNATSLKGPFTDQEIAKITELNGMQVLDPGDAWKKLN